MNLAWTFENLRLTDKIDCFLLPPDHSIILSYAITSKFHKISDHLTRAYSSARVTPKFGRGRYILSIYASTGVEN